MKQQRSLWAVALGVILGLALIGCGGDAEKTATDAAAPATEQTAKQETWTENAAAATAKAIVGNHIKTNALLADREQARKFYIDVLGAAISPGPAENIDMFMFPNGVSVGVVFLEKALTIEEQMAGGTWLELQSADTEKLQAELIAFGITPIDFGMPGFFFAAPGGQIYRLEKTGAGSGM